MAAKRKQLTNLQCDLVLKLMKTGNYLRRRPSHSGRSGWILLSSTHEPLRWYSDGTAACVKDLLKQGKNFSHTLNLKLVRQLDGRSFIKKAYKKTRLKKVQYD
jgi:hypothetical protein